MITAKHIGDVGKHLPAETMVTGPTTPPFATAPG